MADIHSSLTLGYGTPGTATYDQRSGAWSFLRPLDSNPAANDDDVVANNVETFPFHPVGRAFEVLKRPNSHFSTANKDSKAIDDGHTLTISRRVLEQEVRASDGWPPISGHRDPLFSNCLAFGNALMIREDLHERTRQTTPIVVHAWGCNRNVLRLVKLGRESAELRSKSGNLIEAHVPSIGDVDEAWWLGPGAEIRQVCFAESVEYEATWMAVRMSTCTVIFRPAVHRVPVPPRAATTWIDPAVFGPSLLDANPVVILPMSRTGGRTHACVAFDPTDEQRLALVDDHGTWSIWTIKRKARKSARVIDCIELQISGSLHDETEIGEDSQYFDGWHSIQWLANGRGNIDRILVLSRRTAALFSVFDGERLEFEGLDLGHSKHRHWILDTHRSANQIGMCYILTSEQLLWLSSSVPEWMGSGRRSTNLYIVLSWRHFLDPEDNTLYLTVLDTKHGMNSLRSVP